MLITQKHKYALRAIYELGKRFKDGQVKLAATAEAQTIPLRFLEVIMAELKPTGITISRPFFPLRPIQEWAINIR